MDDLKDVVEWDVATWSRAIRYWDSIVRNQHPTPAEGLELGARNGGVSYYFATEFGCKMACTDVEHSGIAKELHTRRGVTDLISYREANACAIPWENEAFDFVVFKSILGVVGARGERGRQAQAIEEIQRVLKPGGLLLFAENLAASRCHQLARKWFVPWGEAWSYLALPELRDLLQGFQSSEVKSTGFSSAFVPRPEALRSICATIDNSVLRWLPDKWNYVGYGHAVK